MAQLKKAHQENILNNLNRAYNAFINKETICSYLPIASQIELTEKCNLKCVMCQSRRVPIIRNRVINSVVIKKMLNFEGNFFCTFVGRGEPLMYPHFDNIFSRLLARGSYVEIVTNGTLLSKEKIDKLIQIKPHFIIFSIDGLGNLYESIRVNASFESTYQKLLYLRDSKKTKNSKLPDYAINMVVMRKNIKEILPMIEFCYEIGASSLHLLDLGIPTDTENSYYEFFRRENPLLNKESLNDLRSTVIRGFALSKELGVHFVVSRGLLNGIESPQKFKEDCNTINLWKEVFLEQGFCALPWIHIYVAADGKVYPCCMSLDAPWGNLNRLSLYQIWNSEAAKQFRKKIAIGKVPCRACYVCFVRRRNYKFDAFFDQYKRFSKMGYNYLYDGYNLFRYFEKRKGDGSEEC